MKMKNLKLLLPLIAVVFAVAGGFAKEANSKVEDTKATTLYFHYVPNTMSDAQYTAASNWQESSPEESPCNSAGNITCLVDVTDSQIAAYPGATEEDQFANFLADQSSPSGYVAQHLIDTKSAQ